MDTWNQTLNLNSDKLWEVTFEAIHDAVSIHAEDGTILKANKAFADLVGLKKQEVIGKKCFSVVHRLGGFPDYCPLKKTCATGCTTMVEVDEVILGKKLAVYTSTVEDIAEGQKLCVHVVRDMSEWRDAQQRMSDYAGELKSANQQLALLSKRKSEFVASTAHELRTPLNSIIGYINLLLEEVIEDPQEHHKALRFVQQSSQHLLSLINELLEIARIEAGKTILYPEEADLAQAFEQVYMTSAFSAQDKGLKLIVENPLPGEGLVWADPKRLHQVLLNIVNNAIKYTEQGEIHIRSAIDPSHPKMVIVEVQDTGIGIALEKQEHLFERFYQTEDTFQLVGTGLGLAVSQGLVELMGGKIKIHSEGEGKGSTVTFTIPRVSSK